MNIGPQSTGSSVQHHSWLTALRQSNDCDAVPHTDPVQDLVGVRRILGADLGSTPRDSLTISLASTLLSIGTDNARMVDPSPLLCAQLKLSTPKHGTG